MQLYMCVYTINIYIYEYDLYLKVYAQNEYV